MRLLAAKTGVMLAKPAALAIPWSSLGISGKSYCRPPHNHTLCAPSCKHHGSRRLLVYSGIICHGITHRGGMPAEQLPSKNCQCITMWEARCDSTMIWLQCHRGQDSGPQQPVACLPPTRSLFPTGAVHEAPHLHHVVAHRLAPLVVQPGPGGADISHLALVDFLQGLPL